MSLRQWVSADLARLPRRGSWIQIASTRPSATRQVSIMSYSAHLIADPRVEVRLGQESSGLQRVYIRSPPQASSSVRELGRRWAPATEDSGWGGWIWPFRQRGRGRRLSCDARTHHEGPHQGCDGPVYGSFGRPYCLRLARLRLQALGLRWYDDGVQTFQELGALRELLCVSFTSPCSCVLLTISSRWMRSSSRKMAPISWYSLLLSSTSSMTETGTKCKSDYSISGISCITWLERRISKETRTFVTWRTHRRWYPIHSTLLCSLKPTSGHVAEVMSCAWNPKDPKMFITSSADSTIRYVFTNSPALSSSHWASIDMQNLGFRQQAETEDRYRGQVERTRK